MKNETKMQNQVIEDRIKDLVVRAYALLCQADFLAMQKEDYCTGYAIDQISDAISEFVNDRFDFDQTDLNDSMDALATWAETLPIEIK